MENFTNEGLSTLDKQSYLQTFRRFPLALEKGEGCKIWDVEGKEYIDGLAGIAVNCLGYNHPKLTEAICEQAKKLLHISNFYVSPPQVALASKLTMLSGMERIFFANSGAEAAEGAIKLGRKYGHSVGRGGEVISMENCFHGRTLATIAAGKKAMQNGFGPIPEGFKQVPFNDIEALKKAITPKTGAIIMELIQGEGGINEAEIPFVQQVRKLCDEENIALIFDEIQTGIGRTGKWFAKCHYGVKPDIMMLAKGLGGGVPIGAFLAVEKVASAIEFGDHGTTFGGNPLACAAALAVINTISEENLLDAALQKGQWFKAEVEKAGLPGFKKFKGKGLMIGLEFDFETKPVVTEMLNQGVLANATAGNVLRLVPPLIISEDELKTILNVIRTSIEKTQQND